MYFYDICACRRVWMKVQSTRAAKMKPELSSGSIRMNLPAPF